MTKPAIYMDSDPGVHNLDHEASRDRLVKGDTYKDVSTVMVMPTRGVIPARVCQSVWGMMTMMNQKFTRIVLEGMEVGEAYSHAVDIIINNPELSQWKYMLTVEEDNLPPPDGLQRLVASMAANPDYAAISGLYWTKGEGGQPMAYGRPEPGKAIDFIPWLPDPDTVAEVHGIGMGFALWRIDVFKDERLPKPLFKTLQEYTPGVGARAYTQDLFACHELRKLGYKFAVDTGVRVGHWDQENQIAW